MVDVGMPPTGTGSADGIPGSFDLPGGISLDENYYYLSDGVNRTLRRVNRKTKEVQTIVGSVGVIGTTDGPGATALLNSPSDTLLDGTTLYVSDVYNYCIRTVNVADPNFTVSTLVGTCGSSGSADGVGPAAEFAGPTGMVKLGNALYVIDRFNNTIRKVKLDTLEVTTIAGSSVPGANLDAVGTLARFNDPQGLAAYNDPVDGDVLFVTDASNNTIRRIRLSDNNVTTVAGTAGVAGHADGTGAAATFYGPYGLTTDGTSLYVADFANLAVRKILISDYSVTTLFGDPTATADNFGPLATTRTPWIPYLHFSSEAGLLCVSRTAFYRVK